MPATDEQIIAFKLGARARKLLGEDCAIEGYELLLTAIAECERDEKKEMAALLRAELTKYEARMEAL